VATLENDILPQHFNTHQPNPPKTYYDAYKGPVTFAIHYSRVGTFVIQSRTRVMGWQFSPRYINMTASMFHVTNLTPGSDKLTTHDDSRHVPCNQSDTRECQP
jgi:hypothetical protein